MPKKYVKRWERGKWPRQSIEQAFWERANKANGCWLWSGTKNDDGYGILRGKSAHRYAYRLLIGEIPKGLEIDHLCSNRNCVNPEHMEAVTHQENVNRSWIRGKRDHVRNVLGDFQSKKTHCRNDHEYSEENTRIDEQGRRRCKECDRLKSKRYLNRKSVNKNT